MRSNYKKIGKFVQQAKNKNNSNSRTVEHLRGINITKEFMPSVANVTGTDLSVYKIVEKNQFAYNPMHVGRDEILPISMLAHEDSVIVSPAYVVFEIVDTNELLPEYLMMWCRRSEFDRNAWFTTDSSVRGGFNWEDFCDLELPVPSIEKQREIVKEYHTITDRIKLNEQLNHKLEDTAQGIYKEWFVDFEFPDENGKPYKSNSGEMVYCEELDMEIPKGWKASKISEIGNVITGKTPSSDYPEDFGIYMPFITPTDYKNYGKFVTESIRSLSNKGAKKLKNKVLKEDSLLVTCIGSDMGKVVINKTQCITNQQINSIILNENKMVEYLYYTLLNSYENLRNIAIGSSTMLMINKTEFEQIKFSHPNRIIIDKFYLLISQCSQYIWVTESMNKKLFKLKEILLSKMATIEG
ncbi:restriction endonuclease subunit S [Sulfurimonas sp.]|uniref:restriction endonuclease subunit S n=1 Tax=Sulfurimonas sp. TaxID=2022749 RepID=UPI00260B0471|nr:restriction endonuclease subunit S [Sulfurimonas sp.]MDD5158099.1 restriction endonuclease subunit S [Sulfurimonas sp.]